VPELPATASFGNIVYNLQQDEYLALGVWLDAPTPFGSVMNFDPIPPSLFDPQSMADSGSL